MIVGKVDNRKEALQGVAATIAVGVVVTPLKEIERQARGGKILGQQLARERHVELGSGGPAQRRAMMVDPEDARAGVGELTQMERRFDLVPGQVGNPNFIARTLYPQLLDDRSASWLAAKTGVILKPW